MRQRRAMRPCDACRQRKSRCVTTGSGSKCSMCEMRPLPCTFTAKPPRRENTARRLKARNDDGTITSLVPEAVLHPELSTQSPESSSRSVVSQVLPLNILSPNHRCLGKDKERFAELYGLTSDMEPLLMVRLSTRCSFAIVAHGLR
jgi:hypothetical protein